LILNGIETYARYDGFHPFKIKDLTPIMRDPDYVCIQNQRPDPDYDPKSKT